MVYDDIFELGCFSPSWVEEEKPTQVFTRNSKDVATLKKELEDIKVQLQEIKNREWQLAKLLQFREHNMALAKLFR